MEAEHQSSSGMEPIPVDVAYESSQDLRSMSLRNIQLEPNEQPSMIFGFTLSEVAQVTIQVAGVIMAAVFGAWAVKSYESANTANKLAQEALQQSLNANRLAIINLCLSDQFREFIDCSTMLQEDPVASIVRGVMPTLSERPRISSSITLSDLPQTSARQSTMGQSSRVHGLSIMGAPPDWKPELTTPTSVTPMATTPIPTTIPTIPLSTTPIPSDTPMKTETPTGVIASTTPKSPTSLSPPGTQIAFGTVVAIIVAVVVTVAIFCLLLIRYRRAKRSRVT